jgi:hypothetical protein
LQLASIGEMHTTSADDAASPLFRQATVAPWYSVLPYVAGGFTYAIVMTLGSSFANDLYGNWRQVVVQVSVYFWPGVVAALIVAPDDIRSRTRIVGCYLGILLLVTLLVIQPNQALTVLALPTVWVGLNIAPTLLLPAFLWRRVHAVGPAVLILLVTLTFGVQSLLWLYVSSPYFQHAVVTVASAAGLSAGLTVIALVVVGALLCVAVFGWPILRGLGRTYAHKLFSDKMLTIDTLFIVFAFFQGVAFAFQAFWSASWGLLAFFGYKTTTVLSFRVMRRSGSSGPTLLLLRVFRLGYRSEILLETLRRHWQLIGSMYMIGGPDLIASTIEPYRFLTFLSGNIAKLFVASPDDLKERLARLDHTSDPDGRYRINEFFCHIDNWQATMEALALRSDAVLMDLRGFSPANKGCEFEIGALLNTLDLRRVLLAVDSSTDQHYLQNTLHRLWMTTRGDSVNLKLTAPTIRIFHISDHPARDIALLLHTLLTMPVADTTHVGAPSRVA